MNTLYLLQVLAFQKKRLPGLSHITNLLSKIFFGDTGYWIVFLAHMIRRAM